MWTGFAHEFRNHISALTRVSHDVRHELMPSSGPRAAQLMSEIERNLQGLTALVALVDASVQAGDLVIARLGDVVDRAVRVAASGTSPSIVIEVRVPRDIGVRNRGAMLETLLGALVLEAARATDAGAARVTIDAEVGRRGLVVEIASTGTRPDAPSWRFALASDLAAKLDATLTSPPGAAAFLIQFH